MSSELQFNPLSANFTKWSNTLKQFVAKLPTNRLSMFDHVVGLALKGLTTKIFIDLNHSTSGHSSYIECTYDDDMTSRSSHRKCTLKKVFLKILQNLQENSCVRVFFNKAAGLWQSTSFHRTPPGEYLWTYWASYQLLTYVQIKTFIQGVVAFLKKRKNCKIFFGSSSQLRIANIMKHRCFPGLSISILLKSEKIDFLYITGLIDAQSKPCQRSKMQRQ